MACRRYLSLDGGSNTRQEVECRANVEPNPFPFPITSFLYMESNYLPSIVAFPLLELFHQTQVTKGQTLIVI